MLQPLRRSVPRVSSDGCGRSGCAGGSSAGEEAGAAGVAGVQTSGHPGSAAACAADSPADSEADAGAGGADAPTHPAEAGAATVPPVEMDALLQVPQRLRGQA